MQNQAVHEAVHVGDLEKEEFRVLINGFNELTLLAVDGDLGVDVLQLAGTVFEYNDEFFNFLAGLLALVFLLLLLRLLIKFLLYLMLK